MAGDSPWTRPPRTWPLEARPERVARTSPTAAHGKIRAMWDSVADYVRSLDVDAWLVGGAVRDDLLGRPHDEDFVVPGVGHEELKRRLAPHGGVEDLVVAGQQVGVRLYPNDREARALQPAGVEFTPPRRERSTGPGRHDFVIEADPDLTLEEDMTRRDFTINAMARNLQTDELLDPLGGAADLRAGVLRTTSPTSFRDDPLRIVRGLRFVSELDLDPDAATLAQMREWAPQVRLVSGERIGGGLAGGVGELSKLLLGSHPAKALRIARDTGVLTVVLPEYEPALDFDQDSRWHGLPLDEHHFEAVQHSADAGAPLAVRLALLLHDLGKPESAWRGEDGRLHYYARPELGKQAHEQLGAEIAGRVLSRLRYPTDLAGHVHSLVLQHGFRPADRPVKARAFLAAHGADLAFDLVAHKRADLLAKGRPVDDDLARLDAFEALLEQERHSPHRLADLAVDGEDLIELGFVPGPELGEALRVLLEDVVADPTLNTADVLRQRARRLIA